MKNGCSPKHIQVDIVHSIIGLRTPQSMRKNGYLEIIHTPEADYYGLTDTGIKWLMDWVEKHKYL